MICYFKNFFVIFAIMFGISTNLAKAETLSGAEIKQVIQGQKFYLSTKYGVEFPLVYRKNGTVSGDGTGTGLGKFFAPKETGRWWVSGRRLCQQFKTWYDGKRLCFTLEKTGAKTLIWRQGNGDSGKARIAG